MQILKQFCTFFLVFCSLSNAAYAADLMDIFRSVRDHDPHWAAQLSKLKASEQAVPSAEALLYPKIVTTGYTSSVHTTGDGGTIINPVYLDESLLAGCLIDIRQDDPCKQGSLVIRDDFGGRYDTYTLTLQFTQPLYNYIAWKHYTQAKIHETKAAVEHEKAQQELILKVAESYFAVLRAYEQWEHANTEADSVGTQLEQTKKRFKLGLLPQNDVYDVRAAHDLSKVKLLVARTALENSQENLALMTQRRDVSIATLSNKLVVEPPQPKNVEEWVKTGLKHNRTLQIAHAATLIAKDELAVQRGGYHPTVDIHAGQQLSKNDEVAFESSPSVRTTGVGIQFRYPLYLGGLTTAKVKASHHHYNQSLDLFELARRNVIRNVRNNYRKVSNDVLGVEAAQQAIHSNEKSLESARAGYKNGTRPLLAILKAQSDLFTAKKDHANLRYDFILDSLKLKYEVGTLEIEDLQIVNSWLELDKLILPPDLMIDQEIEEDIFY